MSQHYQHQMQQQQYQQQQQQQTHGNGGAHLGYGPLLQREDLPVRPALFTANSSSPVNDTSSRAQRSVVRAACLNCRFAKRRCDGASPVCGPCQNRGVEAGGCTFVSSKRGGPRYKGVKGADAAKVKVDKDRAREASKRARSRKSDQDASKSSTCMTSDAGSTASQHSNSPPGNATDGRATNFNNNGSSSSAQSPGTASNQSISAYSGSNSVPLTSQGQSFDGSYSISPDPNQQYYPPSNTQSMQRRSAQSSQSHPFMTNNEPLSPLDETFFNGQGGPLSFANLELWQRIQERSTNEDLAAFADFYNRVESLPKAGPGGGHNDGINIDPLDVLMDWEGGETGNNLQDNEQGARNLLTDFYEMVYPACPVLLPPGNLSSLVFYFSGKGPCGLFAAISSVVTLHLPHHEAIKTLKNSQSVMARFEGRHGSTATPLDNSMPTDEIAAYHAKTSELILHQYSEAKAACFIDTTCSNPFAGLDEELIIIEAAAAHTLLCHYYYGSGKPLSHQRAYKHAVEAWNLAQKLDLQTRTNTQENSPGQDRHPEPSRPFSSDLKLEWGKRVYWVSYTAATVMSCTGGFIPFGNPKDEVMDLKLRPHLEHDVAAWGIMMRGAQQVSKTYRLLYDLDVFRARLANKGVNMDQNQLHQAAVERQTIFNAMLKLDSEIGTYTRFDPSWRNVQTETESRGERVDYIEGLEKQLADSLKMAGRLMTSGALIILHRAQAFSNARVFMQPQCGIPEAIRLHKPVQYDVILHKAVVDISGSGADNLNGGNENNTFGIANNLQYTTQSPSNDSMNRRGALTEIPASSNTISHPFLTDRFAGGPFEPTHSLERCRFAASAMIGTLPTLLSNKGAPKLPPYSACSFVLGAYATLMLTLLIQVHAEEAEQNKLKSNGAFKSSQKAEELKRQLIIHRAPVKDIIVILNRFAAIWPKAVEYQHEVATLLAANENIA